MFLCPSESFLIVLFVVDAFFHAAKDLNLVNGFHTHTEVAFHHILIHDGACDTHALRTDLEIGFALHGSNRNSGTTEAKELFFYVFGDLGNLVAVLNLMTVDTECGKTLLCMTCKNGCKVNRAGTFGAVKAPNGFDGGGVHIHGFGAIAPAGCYGKSNGYAFFFEFVCTSGSFGNTTDRCISHNDLYVFTVGIVEIIFKELFCCVCHCPYLSFERFAEHHRTTASVNNRANTDYGIIANVSVLCHW